MAECISGIYCIKNIINGKMYIGQSHDINWRWTTHKRELKQGRHHNSYLQNAWDKYGDTAFVFMILEECQINQLDELETEWITFLRTNVSCKNSNGYNLDLGGKGIRGYKHTKKEIDKMRRIQNPDIVLQFDLDFNFVKEWIGGANHIDKVLGYTKDCILLRCEHTILDQMTPYKDSYWIYKKEYECDDFSWEKYLSNYRTKEYKTICQYDTNFKLIKKWYSHKDIENSGYNLCHVLHICNRSGTQKLHQGYIWAYEDYDFSDGRYGYGSCYEKNKHFTRKVNMKKEKDGDVINTFNSMGEACVFLGRPKKQRCRINVAIKTNRRFSGYYWEYAD